ncbi:MAG: GGDEF domain-containing protein [Oscillospiraceae bacterium]|nr:GGDEF domain-containing protein [Oscillospiraceae bacterium]
MRPFSRIRMTASALFGAVAVLFFVFFIYMGLTENISVYSGRHAHDFHAITDYTVEYVEDSAAPAGVRTVYTWEMHDVANSESCLCFYLVHHFAKVYIDGELIHSLTARETNRMGGTVSSNWVTVPVHEEDNGKQLQLVLTPLFAEMVDFEPEFLLGSHFTIVFDQLRQDLPQLFISMLCIILGVLIIIVQMYFNIRTHARSVDMIYLGSFANLLGLWRLTDLKSAPIIFSSNPMVLGYISIGCLFLCSVVLLLYASTLFSEKKATPLLVFSMAGSAVSLVVLLIQILGILDFKQMLPISHGMLIVTIVSVPAVTMIYRHTDHGRHISSDWFYFLILAAGMLLDLLQYYIHGSSAHVVFTVVGFLLYTLIVFVTNILDTTHKAYVDAPTGLVNRAHWDELMHDDRLEAEFVGMIMMDLNGLKKVNDTYGHAKGDLMIRRFSALLLDTFPSSSHICRWGGDEFAVMMVGSAAKKLEQYVAALRQTVDAYNAETEDLPISYALGYAFSTEFEGIGNLELLTKADERMYQDKKSARR